MSRARPSDAEFGQLLRAHLPAGAHPGLHEAIVAKVETTRQVRPAPGVMGILLDADPLARRRAVLIAATLLLAIGAVAAGVVGSGLHFRVPAPLVDVPPQVPRDLPGLVRSAYGDMPKLPPMTIMTLEDGTTKGRIFVDRSGAVRIEHFPTRDATEPDTYTILAGSSLGELRIIDSRPAWYEQSDAIMEDPRVFVFAELGGARYGTGLEYGCEVAVSPGEVYAYTPGSAWQYVGLESVAGRPAHHVSCKGVGDMWLDVETSLTMRSQGPLRGQGGWPVAGILHTIEVTAIDLGQPSPALFDLRAPAGARVLSEEERGRQDCIRYGWCLASPRPVVTPPPAPDAKAVITAAELVARSHAAPLGLGAYTVTIEETKTGMTDAGTRTLVMFDGVGRYRLESTSQIGTVWESTSVTLIGDGYRYSSEIQVDGTTVWRRPGRRDELPLGSPYPLEVAARCDVGWEQRGVDVVGGRVADHVRCAGDDTSDYWIDRATNLVVRTQASGDPLAGTSVQEVVDLQLGMPRNVEWDLPANADVR